MEKTSTAGKVTDPVAKHAGTMMLMGDKVDLSKHVGHQVAITGVMADPVKSGAMTKSEEINKGAAAQPMGGITVTTLKMVGTTCQM